MTKYASQCAGLGIHGKQISVNALLFLNNQLEIHISQRAAKLNYVKSSKKRNGEDYLLYSEFEALNYT